MEAIEEALSAGPGYGAGVGLRAASELYDKNRYVLEAEKHGSARRKR